jgi:glutathione peroxidase
MKKNIVCFEKGREVNGAKTRREIFSFLKRELPGKDGSENIRWNFSKFLIDSEGKPYKRYGYRVEPNDMVE